MEITSKGSLMTIGCKGYVRCMVRGFLLQVLVSSSDEVGNILLCVQPVDVFSNLTNNTVYSEVSHITM